MRGRRAAALVAHVSPGAHPSALGKETGPGHPRPPCRVVSLGRLRTLPIPLLGTRPLLLARTRLRTARPCQTIDSSPVSDQW